MISRPIFYTLEDDNFTCSRGCSGNGDRSLNWIEMRSLSAYYSKLVICDMAGGSYQARLKDEAGILVLNVFLDPHLRT